LVRLGAGKSISPGQEYPEAEMTVQSDPQLALTPRRRQRPSLLRRIPVIGGIARELVEGDADYPFYLLAATVSAWACAVLIWGLPALYLPALVLSPVVMLMLVALTRG
jgi:anti-sigma factor RsiW